MFTNYCSHTFYSKGMVLQEVLNSTLRDYLKLLHDRWSSIEIQLDKDADFEAFNTMYSKFKVRVNTIVTRLICTEC